MRQWRSGELIASVCILYGLLGSRAAIYTRELVHIVDRCEQLVDKRDAVESFDRDCAHRFCVYILFAKL